MKCWQPLLSGWALFDILYSEYEDVKNIENDESSELLERLLSLLPKDKRHIYEEILSSFETEKEIPATENLSDSDIIHLVLGETQYLAQSSDEKENLSEPVQFWSENKPVVLNKINSLKRILTEMGDLTGLNMLLDLEQRYEEM